MAQYTHSSTSRATENLFQTRAIHYANNLTANEIICEIYRLRTPFSPAIIKHAEKISLPLSCPLEPFVEILANFSEYYAINESLRK